MTDAPKRIWATFDHGFIGVPHEMWWFLKDGQPNVPFEDELYHHDDTVQALVKAAQDARAALEGSYDRKECRTDAQFMEVHRKWRIGAISRVSELLAALAPFTEGGE